MRVYCSSKCGALRFIKRQTSSGYVSVPENSQHQRATSMISLMDFKVRERRTGIRIGARPNDDLMSGFCTKLTTRISALSSAIGIKSGLIFST